MKIEVHVIQNFASSNLNRDDTGSPKDCEFGGVRRARVSSQCLKRAMREAFQVHKLLPPSDRAARTKRLVERVAAIVEEKNNVSSAIAQQAVATALAGAGLKADPAKEWKTQYLLFVPMGTVEKLADIVIKHFSALSSEPISEAEGGKKEGARSSAKKAKADAKGAISPDIAKEVSQLLSNGSKTSELALFGRMIADEPSWNLDAACQVAHAVSTHRMSMEFDFYTAIDDLKKDDTAGSDMMGTVSFNSACFYRYLVVDVDSLEKNLGGDADAKVQVKTTIDALLKAAVLAIPTGKQNSMAAQNLPSLVMIDVRNDAAPRSLANAFVNPVRPKAGTGGDLVLQSIERLGRHYSALETVYGSDRRRKDGLSFFLVDDSENGDSEETTAKKFQKQTGAIDRKSLDGLVKATLDVAFDGNNE